MSCILDSSAIFKAITEDAVQSLLGNYTVELARYELGNTLWKQHALRKKLSSDELKRLIRLVKQVLSIMEVLGIDCHEEDILGIAEKLKLTFYDASYVFYAKEKNLPLITEDETLIEKVKPHIKALRASDLKYRA